VRRRSGRWGFFLVLFVDTVVAHVVYVDLGTLFVVVEFIVFDKSILNHSMASSGVTKIRISRFDGKARKKKSEDRKAECRRPGLALSRAS
jgi:hypothetical protein